MSAHTPHELAEELPEYKEQIRDLKMTDAHFAKLAKRYHKTNRRIHRIEAGVKAASDFRMEDLKKKRLYLIDIITHILHNSPKTN